jgi:M6 family metalloprotease-like protein
MKLFKKRSFVFMMVPLLLTCLIILGTDNKQEKQDLSGMQFVSANPNAVDVEQPDGKILTVRLKGDEWLHLGFTTDSYTVMQNKKGVYFYAVHDDKGDLVLSKFKAHNPADRTKLENNKLAKIQKRLTFSKSQAKKAFQKHLDSTAGDTRWGGVSGQFPTTGTRNMLIILGDFTDMSFIKTQAQFDDLFNTGSTSFKAYYQDNSYNLLTVNCTVVGPYTPNYDAADADESCSTCIRGYISSLVDMAEADGLDFSQFDNNNDGDVDGLFVVHAGFGEEAGAPTWTIWSHAWTLFTYARTYDGVTIDRYATVPELRGTSGSTMTAIGVCVHEFGHLLGAPDLYDTDGTGSGGTAWDCGRWDVMAGGSWNDSGDTPAQHNMYSKWKLGWSNPVVLSSSASISLQDTGISNTAYRIDTTTNNEFFILENRQQTGWDAALPGHGMLVFHIDGNYIDSLSGNTVNADPSHQGVDVEEADNVRSTATYTADPFPGTANKTSFTDTTIPSSKSWANANTNKPVTNIAENTGLIYFDFMGGSGSASITANFTFIANGLSVDFTDTSIASSTTITDWDWDFGDGNTSTAQNPSHTYAANGTYTVSLTASDSGTTTDTTSKPVTVDSSVFNYCNSEGTDYSYEWIGNVTVGDVNNSSGSAGYTDFTYITCNVTESENVSVSITPVFSGTVYTEHCKIYIDYNLDGDFEDAGEQVFYQVGTSTVTGSFTVPTGISGVTRMRVSMKYDSEQTACETFAYGEVEDYTINISGGTVVPPVANFSASATVITQGDTVNFTDLSTNTPTSWAWTFDGGTPGTSTAQNPSVTYNTAGTYTVQLIATNSAGSDTELKVDFITVNAPPAPVANFTASATTIDETQSVTFTDTSANAPDTWDWTFEGGTPATSTARNPIVTYNTAGTYTVTLVATNDSGSDTETKIDYITVNAPGSCLGEITNAGFETGDTSGWTATGVTVTTDSNSGTYGVSLDASGSRVEQVITGLCPNTSYTLSAFGKAKSLAGFFLGVSNYGGAEQTAQFTNSKAFTQMQIVFTTGASDTSATIFFKRTGSKFTTNGDDFTLTKN